MKLHHFLIIVLVSCSIGMLSCTKDNPVTVDDRFLYFELNGKSYLATEEPSHAVLYHYENYRPNYPYYQDGDFHVLSALEIKAVRQKEFSLLPTWCKIQFNLDWGSTLSEGGEKISFIKGHGDDSHPYSLFLISDSSRDNVEHLSGWIQIDTITPNRAIGRFEFDGTLRGADTKIRNGRFKWKIYPAEK